MTPNGVAVLFSRLDWLWPDQAVETNQGLFETWLGALKPVEDDEVFEAVPIMAMRDHRRPSIADIIQSAKAVRGARSVVALAPYIPQTKAYGEAWHAVGVAAREGRLPIADLNELSEKHQLWFKQNGEDLKATPEMIAEVRALAAKVMGVIPPPAVTRDRATRVYSDAHKARYMAAVEEKERQGKEEPE